MELMDGSSAETPAILRDVNNECDCDEFAGEYCSEHGTNPWKITGPSGDGKVLYVEGPNELLLEIDTDDVDLDEVRRGVLQMVRKLNAPCPYDSNGDGDCGKRFCPYCGEYPH